MPFSIQGNTIYNNSGAVVVQVSPAQTDVIIGENGGAIGSNMMGGQVALFINNICSPCTGGSGGGGNTILNGVGAPDPGLGDDGDFYIDTTADEIYGPKASGAWGAGTSLVGPQGDPGQGVPAGGTAAQVLAKIDGTDYNTQWVNQSGGAQTLTVTAGEDVAARDLIYIAADGLAYRADVTAIEREVIAVANAEILTGDTGAASLPGALITGFSALTPGTRFFVSDTPGALSEVVQPAGSVFIQQVGHAVSATSVLFRPGFPIGITSEAVAETFYRLLENGDIRITEGGDYRIFETVTANFLITEGGDSRITENGDFRILEN